MLFGQLFGTHLRVRGGVGMNHEALYIGYVGQQRENLQIVDKSPGLFLSPLDFEGEDAAATLGEVLLIECMVGV